MAPVLLDLFCAAGGASAGYARAGFRVVGVDLAPQPHYPYDFRQGDALELLPELVAELAPVAVTASPPCFANSVLRNLEKVLAKGYADMIPETRDALEATGLPYVIENVPGAGALRVDLELCGSMFRLGADCRDGVRRYLKRHRWFESNVPLLAPGPCRHAGQAIGVHGGGPSSKPRTNRPGRPVAYQGVMPERRAAMGIDWMNRAEINLAIPPAYTAWIGRQLRAQLGLAAA
jgi:DNA (cytosine-5)-methyltransferase 1